MAIDPICGMTVDEASALPAGRDGETFYFCSDHCRRRDEPELRLGHQQRLAAAESEAVIQLRNMNIAVDLGDAERERFLAVKRVSALTERDPDAGASAGSATQEAQ